MLSTSYSVAINPSPNQEDLAVLFSGRSQTEPQHEVGPQVLDYYLIHYVVSGKGQFSCRGKSYFLSAGTSFVIFPGELVKYVSDSDEPWKYRWVAMKGTKVKHLFNSLDITPDHPVRISETPKRTQVLFAKIMKVLQQADAATDLEATGYLNLLLADFTRQNAKNRLALQEQKSHAQIQVEQAIRWLTLQHSQPVTIDEMAQSLGYHRTYLAKIFKQQTGMSPKDYLHRVRMERALQLLGKPLTIKEVASSVGFNDALYFSKQFKKWYGYSPTEYRENHSPVNK